MLKTILIGCAVYIGLITSVAPAVAQMAAVQLTNPAIDAVNGEQTAAWVADENLGVLYCELVRQTSTAQKRVACFDSNGEVATVPKTMPNR